MLPEEAMRPVIFLDLYGEHVMKSSFVHVAILGGMGPISDASLLNKVISKISANNGDTTNVRIHLLSAAPPRRLIRILTTSLSYLLRVHSFLQSPYSVIFLASNTAHIFYSLMNYLGNGNVYNLCQDVALAAKLELARCGCPEGAVLILGTALARSRQLYDTYLSQYGIPFVNVSNLQDQHIQNQINIIKSGGHADDTVPSIIESILTASRIATPHNLSAASIGLILLGCTELPLAFPCLKNERTNEILIKGGEIANVDDLNVKSYLDKLHEEFNVSVLDSEDIFASIIANHCSKYYVTGS